MRHLQPYEAKHSSTPESKEIASRDIGLLTMNILRNHFHIEDENVPIEPNIINTIRKIQEPALEIIHATQRTLRGLRALILGSGANPPAYSHYEPWLARGLYYAEANVVAVDFGRFDNEPPYQTYAQCDLTQEENIALLMNESQFDVVVAYNLLDSPDVPPERRQILCDNVFRLAEHLLDGKCSFYIFSKTRIYREYD